jgi:hypothetical protein
MVRRRRQLPRQRRAVLRQLETGTQFGPFRARANGAGIGPVAAEQAEGSDQDGLAGPGLAGDAGEAFTNVQVERVDDGVIANLQEREHPQLPLGSVSKLA